MKSTKQKNGKKKVVTKKKGVKIDPRSEFINSKGGNKDFREYLWDMCAESGEYVQLFEPGCMDGGIVGIIEGGDIQNRVVYDYDKLCEALAEDYLKYNSSKDGPKIKEYGFDEAFAEAVDWVEFNTLRSLPYAGPNCPIVIRKCPGLEY